MLPAAGRRPEAAAQFRLTLESDPDNAQALDNLGLLFQTQGDTDEAIEPIRARVTLYLTYGPCRTPR